MFIAFLSRSRPPKCEYKAFKHGFLRNVKWFLMNLRMAEQIQMLTVLTSQVGGDFGLPRLQGNGDLSEETRVIGTFGYMAPEYAQTGLVIEKVDVYFLVWC